MKDGDVVLMMLFVNLALLSSSTNCVGIRDVAVDHGETFSDSFHEFNYCNLNYSVEIQTEHQIGWEMRAADFNHISIGSEMELSTQDVYCNSTLTPLSGVLESKKCHKRLKAGRNYGDQQYINLVEEIVNKNFDAADADTEIKQQHSVSVVGASQYDTDFSQPYSVSGLTMVIKTKPHELNQFWWFVIPFTPNMWLSLLALTAFTGFAVCIVDRQDEDGPTLFEALLFFVRREPPRNSLTYLVLIPWLFLILVVTSTYSTSFTSMITSSETEPSCFYLQSLQKANAIIGCDRNSYIYDQLVATLGFQEKNIKDIPQSSMDHYAKALSSGNIKAAFFPTPYANVFLAKYRKGFSAWEQMPYQPNSGIVFPRGSPFVLEMSKLQQRLQDVITLHFPYCSSSIRDGSINGVGAAPFSGLFMLSGVASTTAMIITGIRLMKKRWESCIWRILTASELWVWLVTLTSQNRRRNSIHNS